MRRLNRGQVEIFNFSFLDILACTIALLIFIMVMVFVLQSGRSALADTSKVVARESTRAAALEDQAQRDDRIAAQLEENIGHLGGLVDRQMLNARSAAKAKRDAAQTQLNHDEDMVASLTQGMRDNKEVHDQLVKAATQVGAALGKARSDYAAAEKRHGELLAQVANNRVLIRPANAPGDPASDATVLHIDCQRDNLVVMRLREGGKPEILGSVSTQSVDAPDSAFRKAVQQHRNAAKPVLVFWVRPDGIGTFEKAKELVPPGVDYGYEPAAADWNFADQGN